MKFRYRIQNKQGQILSHTSNAQEAANVITGLGQELCENYYSIDLTMIKGNKYTTYKFDYLINGWVGIQHSDYNEVMKVLK